MYEVASLYWRSEKLLHDYPIEIKTAVFVYPPYRVQTYHKSNNLQISTDLLLMMDKIYKS